MLVGTSEVLASVTGLEFFFSQAPPSMRSIMASLNLVSTGLGTWLVGVFIQLVNVDGRHPWISDNLNEGHLDWYFYLVGALCLCTWLAFLRTALAYRYNDYERELMVLDDNKSDPDQEFEDVLMTTPRNSSPADDAHRFDYEMYTTPPAIKDRAKSTAAQN